MSVKSYQKIIPVTAIQFEGNSSTHTDEIFAFVQFPISINLAGNVVELRVIVNPLKPLVVLVGDYIVKDTAGTLKHMKQDEFESEYTLMK
ncbi:hypothetical protein [Paenibacillus taichungensis]|uniref:Uncharacterized protein n=1 Tax=Paenibacillus taichungensis TaxID=484184 RepID=A0A329QN04_9BACL|nr:hypothetical protein [Paenibacillus taichungensis]RAW13720.1 hypothetical protein DC345_18195 [Paenibacillus taichungensis]